MTQTTAHFVRMTVALRVQAWSEVDIHTNSHAMRRAAPSPRPQRQQNDGTATCTCYLLLLCALVSRPRKKRAHGRGDTAARQTRRVLLLNNNDGRSELQPQKSDARTAVSTTEIPRHVGGVCGRILAPGGPSCMLVRRTTRGRSQRRRRWQIRLADERDHSLEKTRRSLVFYRASSDLICIWFPLDLPPSDLI